MWGCLRGLHSTAGEALACGGACGACTALLVRPWRAGVLVGPAQHCWCGPGVRGFLWGLHSTAGAALACGGACGACTALLVRPWRAGVPVGPAQLCWCGPSVRGFSWGLHSTAGAALVCGGSRGACTALLVRPWRVGGGGLQERGSRPGTPAGGGGPVDVPARGWFSRCTCEAKRKGGDREGGAACARRGGGGAWEGRVRAREGEGVR